MSVPRVPLPMSGYRTPLDAYRDDLARAHGRRRLSERDDYWIVLATGLRRLVQLPARSRSSAAKRLAAGLRAAGSATGRRRVAARPATAAGETGEPMAVAAALAGYPDAGMVSALVRQVRGVAADAEEVGAVALAREMLTDLRALTSSAEVLEQGRVLLQLGRIARTVGELDTAVDLLRAAGDLGRAHRMDELLAREALGIAVIARTRGNYPDARRSFEQALQLGTRLGLGDVVGMAHQGLMIAEAESGRMDAALQHGWAAYSSARSAGAREAEVVGNLSLLCARGGYDHAAVGGYLVALTLTDAPRVRIPVLAGLVAAAARLGDAPRVDMAESAIRAESSMAFPYEAAGAWLAVSKARHLLGDAPASEAARLRAAALAREHGFHEILHRVDQPAGSPAALTAGGTEVIRQMEAWADSVAFGSIVSTPTG